MQKREKQSFLQGAMILTISTMMVKVIGMFYKIPLGNLLGAAGMSCFMTAYHIFNPVFALSAAGFPAAVSKLVSENAALGRYRDVRKVFRVSLLLFCIMGVGGSLALWYFGGNVAKMIGNADAGLAVTAMAPSVFFCCVMAAYRGYYQGLANMKPTAASQILESLVKLALGIGAAWWVIETGLNQYHASGTVFGVLVKGGEKQARLEVLPFAAAGAVLGVTASAAAGALFLFLRRLLLRDSITKGEVKASPPPMPSFEILRRLAAIALPICLASGVSHITSLIDVATIMNRLGVALQRDSQTIFAMYGDLLPPQAKPENIPSYLYGVFSYTSSLFNLVPALTAALGVSALPTISAHWTLRNRHAVVRQAQSLLKLSALAAVPAGLGLAAIPGPILALLYPDLRDVITIAAPLLRSMGIAAVLAGMVAPMSSVFQAVGRADIPVKLMCMGGVIKIAANYFLLAVPDINISGAPVGTVLCYGFIFVAGLWRLHTITDMTPDMANMFVKPLICGIFCAVAANTSCDILGRAVPGRWAALSAIVFGGFIYAIFVLFLKIITKNEAYMLPNGKKIVKILEKLSLMG